jgi:hypothetical protein
MRARELKALWGKCWLETRWGFALALAILLAFSLWSVLRFPDAVQGGVRDMQRHHHGNAALKGVATYTQVEIFEKLTILWAMLAAMLGTGGLLKERLMGTAPFLLTLPVGRRRLLAVRSAMTVAQAVCLAIAAYAAVPLAFPLVHQSYGLAPALRYAVILAVSGVPFAIYGIVISVLLEGGNWPGIIGATTTFLLLVLGQLSPGFARYAPFPVLSGEKYFYFGVMPWTGMWIGVAIGSAMLAFAVWMVKWQDF